MAGRRIELGATGAAVAQNVKRFREQRGGGYTKLSHWLTLRGRPISPLAVRRIEEGERRVDVDDLVAIAAGLGVSPLALLMPESKDESTELNVAGITRPVAAKELWRWLRADEPFGDRTPSEIREFWQRSRPEWDQFDRPSRDDLLALAAGLQDRASVLRMLADAVEAGADGDD